MIISKEYFWSLMLAVIIDWLIGDPIFLPHPIVMMGKIISKLETQIRKAFKESQLKMGGFVLLFCMIAIVTLVGVFFEKIIFYFPMVIRISLRAFFMSFMLAAKSLKQESMRVYYELKGQDLKGTKNVSLEGAKKAVARIVGRDVQSLDEPGVIRATVETVAENFSDGVFAPFMYMVCFGLPGGLVYKAINTMDSMIGYKNEKYRDLGFAAAKTDDVANFLPSRMSAFFMILASVFGFRFQNAIKIFFRDRFLSSSPNSAQTEAVCAGALGIRLLGDAYYFGKLVKKAFVGDALREIEREDICRANRLNKIAYLLSISCVVLLYLSMRMLHLF